MERNARDAKPNDTRRDVTGSPRVYYSPREDATPKGELAVLAAVYGFVLERRHERKKGDETESGGEEGEEAAERNRTGGIVSEERP